MGPLRGDGNLKLNSSHNKLNVDKMGPLRGDGNRISFAFRNLLLVEKMGPLRGDGNYPCVAKAEIPKQKVVTY